MKLITTNTSSAVLRAMALSLIFTFSYFSAIADNKWQLKKETDGIKVYTQSVANTDIKALKADFMMDGDMDKLASVLLDISGQKDWVYSTKSSKILKKVGEQELIYYSEKDMPWPVTNRDAVMRIKIERPTEGTMLVSVSPVNGLVAEKNDIVRVQSSDVIWKVTQVNGSTMKVAYQASVDPGGSLPAWVTNMFITKGPLESFKKLREMMK